MKDAKQPSRSGVDRRDFFKSAGAGLLGPELARAFPVDSRAGTAAYSPVQFVPEGNLTRISDNLYVFRDICNVYVLKDGHRALLIDFGTGQILQLLGPIGVTEVSAILHTHYHRDQCQGDPKALAERIPIYVPEQERPFFEDTENLWRNRRVFHLFRNNNDFFSLTQNVAVSGDLRDYETFRWGPYELLIFPTPGHTIGSLSLLGIVDGKKIAFTGDLIHSPGKVVNLYDLQYNYGPGDAVDFAIHSLTRLREQGLELVCPSHGEPFTQPEVGITNLVNKLKGWYEAYSPGTPLTIDNKPYAVSPHLIASDQTTSSFYAIISDSGKALFVDYGSASDNFCGHFGGSAPLLGRMRFVEHTIPQLKTSFGLKSVDVVMPSHMHDDHLNGLPDLTRRYGTKVWCYENMKDVLQNPRGYNLGCIMSEPIKVDRTFQNGETFKWQEFEFQVYHSPGHTEYQMVMFATIDGARVAFTGDAFFPWGSGHSLFRHNLIFHNWVENDSHVKSIRTILEHEPNIVAPGHGKPLLSNKADLEDLKARLEDQQKYFFDVIADQDCDFGLNPNWARLYPYQLHAKAGSSHDLELRVRNYRSNPMHLEATLALPPGWKASPEVRQLTIPSKGDASATFSVTVPADWDRSKPRVAFAADVRADGRCLGQIAECVADIHFA
jgi:glyoxylase-like metal-dependent hydrolase (beta-lactamase superfamily II)